MAINTEIAHTTIASRNAVAMFAAQTSPTSDAMQAEDMLAGNPAEDGVSLNLSARGLLLSALDLDTVATHQSDAIQAAKALPITRATLYAIEARLLAARRGADAIAAADAQRPNSTDPQRQQQALQATDYLYGRAANPFAALPRAQLAAIVYDESGAYTINERYAAAAQRDELDRRFWTPVLERAMNTGDWRPVIEAGLVFYASLSPLEQTAYPANYLQLMRQYLALPEVPIDTPLPSQKQVDLVSLLASLVLPSGPWAQASGVMRNLLLIRGLPSAEALQAALPKLLDVLPANMARITNMMNMTQDQAYQVLLQRVFGVERGDDEPAAGRHVAQANAQSLQPARALLGVADRRFLAAAYAQAAMAGIAFEEVDALAADLARYRQLRAGGTTAAGSATAVNRMSIEDANVARRLLTSSIARETRLDHGFLAWLLDPRGAGWSDGERSGHQVGLSALERLLAGLAGLAMGQGTLEESALEPDYRHALYRIGLLEMAQARPPSAQASASEQARNAALAAMVRDDASERDFMDRALALLRMYRFSLRMSDAEQRTLSELVYASLRRRRLRARRGKLFVAWGEPSPSMPSLPR